MKPIEREAPPSLPEISLSIVPGNGEWIAFSSCSCPLTGAEQSKEIPCSRICGQRGRCARMRHSRCVLLFVANSNSLLMNQP